MAEYPLARSEIRKLDGFRASDGRIISVRTEDDDWYDFEPGEGLYLYLTDGSSVGGRVEWIRVRDGHIIVLTDNGLINVPLGSVDHASAKHVSVGQTIAAAVGFPALLAAATIGILLAIFLSGHY